MKKKYPVITLCGSTRFKDEFMEAQKELTLAGNIVISVGLFGHSGDKEVWEAHKDPKIGVDPFKYYGKQKTARFVEEILMKELKKIR